MPSNNVSRWFFYGHQKTVTDNLFKHINGFPFDNDFIKCDVIMLEPHGTRADRGEFCNAAGNLQCIPGDILGKVGIAISVYKFPVHEYAVRLNFPWLA